MDSLEIGNDAFVIRISRESGGFPESIRLADGSGESGAVGMRVEMKGRGVIRPFLAEMAPVVRREGDKVTVGLEDIKWRDAEGRVVGGYRLALQYEVFADGSVFVKTFLNAETDTPGALRGLCLAPSLDLAPGQDAGWAYWRLPKEMTGQLIQDLGHFERNLPRSEAREMDGTILPFVSFDFGAEGRRDRHIEFFVESWNSLLLQPENTRTAVAWRGRRAEVTWDFQKRWSKPSPRGYHWRNVWGWRICRFPVERRRAPLRVYHFLDNFERYPSNKTIRQVAEQGADTLILHENWRLDSKNGEFPYDRRAMAAVVRACRRHGLRLGLYVRGNEDCVREAFCEPLRPFLERDRDGIYMDYGSPICYLAKEEYAPGGRVHFQEYYEMTRRVREFVGPDGFFISHSGSFFAAVGHATVDGYLGGEQEKGALIRDTTTHAYFSGLSVSPNCLWTAAFPTYRTRRMAPFMACAFQFPFLHLGTQLPTSSLDHPQTPSLMRFARPLWRLWELLDERRGLRCHSTQSDGGVFDTGSPSVGAAAMVDHRGDALLIAANYSARPCRVTLKVAWDKLGLRPGRQVMALRADEEGCVATRGRRGFEAKLDGYGVTGWLVARDLKPWHKPLARFQRPYVSAPADEARYGEWLDTVRSARFDAPAWPQTWLRVTVPVFPNNLEESLWVDLYANDIELVDLTDKRKPKPLGYVGMAGLTPESQGAEGRINPGSATPWIPLQEALPADGKPRTLGLRTRRGEGDFYSLVYAELAPKPRASAATRYVVYNNDLDLDWSLLTFVVRIGRAEPPRPGSAG